MSESPRLVSLWRYPVKSMLGEELNASAISENGILGDRAYAMVDQETGQVVSAKNPKKWPNLFDYRAAYVTPPDSGELPAVWVTLPDGTLIRSDTDSIDAILTESLGRSVQLVRSAPGSASLEQYWPENEGEANEVTREAIAGDAPIGSFFDYSKLHILTTGTLNRFRELYPEGRFEVRRFRPNLVIDTGDNVGFVENDWVGKELRIGSLRLRISDPCPRCVMPTLAQGDLPKDPSIFRQGILKNTPHVPFADKQLPSAGVYARIVEGGMIRRGDSVELLN